MFVRYIKIVQQPLAKKITVKEYLKVKSEHQFLEPLLCCSKKDLHLKIINTIINISKTAYLRLCCSEAGLWLAKKNKRGFYK